MYDLPTIEPLYFDQMFSIKRSKTLLTVILLGSILSGCQVVNVKQQALNVTIATNMAGRGTDIILGGNWKAKLAKLENPTAADEARLKAQWEQDHEDVLQAGGLHIIGS